MSVIEFVIKFFWFFADMVFNEIERKIKLKNIVLFLNTCPLKLPWDDKNWYVFYIERLPFYFSLN